MRAGPKCAACKGQCHEGSRDCVTPESHAPHPPRPGLSTEQPAQGEAQSRAATSFLWPCLCPPTRPGSSCLWLARGECLFHTGGGGGSRLPEVPKRTGRAAGPGAGQLVLGPRSWPPDRQGGAGATPHGRPGTSKQGHVGWGPASRFHSRGDDSLKAEHLPTAGSADQRLLLLPSLSHLRGLLPSLRFLRAVTVHATFTAQWRLRSSWLCGNPGGRSVACPDCPCQ